MKEFICVIVLPIVLIGAALVAVARYYTEWQCTTYHELTGKRTKYVPFDVCYVEHNGTLMRWEEYLRYITAAEVRNEG